MTIDRREDCGARDVERNGLREAVAQRFTALQERFPSASHGLLSILDQAVVSGTSFLTAAMVGRLTSPEQLGLYYLVLSLVVIASGVQEQVIAGPYMVHSKRRFGHELAEYGGSVWLHHLILTLLTVGGLAVVIVLMSAAGSTGILPGLWALLGAGPLLLLRESVRRFAFANLQVKTAIALDSAVAAAQLGGLLLLGRFGMLSVMHIYGVMGGACLLACLGWYFLDPPHIRFNGKRFMADWYHNWAFGKWALWSYVVSGTTPSVMLWIVGLVIGTSATATLGVCATMIGLTNVILSGVANVLTPLAAQSFATRGASELRRILSRSATFVAIVIGGICLMMLAFGDWLVVFVFGVHYQGTGAIPFTLALSALMTGLGMVAGNGLWAIHQPRSAFVADVCGMFVTLISATLLILSFGALGAALAALAGAFTAATLRTMILVKTLADDTLETYMAANTAL